MSFALNEHEHTPYGAEILGRTAQIDSVDAAISAVERFNQQAGGEAFIWIAGKERPVGLISVTSCGDGLVINATPEGAMPPPVSAAQFIKGMRIEARGKENQNIFIRFDAENRAKKIASIRLERLDDAEGHLYIITFESGEYMNIRASSDAETDAPYNSEDIQAGLVRLSAASHRPNLSEEPLICHIPSIRNKYIQSDEFADEVGLFCVVDVVQKKGDHLELELMSISFDDLESMQENPGDQAAGSVAAKCAAFGKGLPLFFIYMRKPYAATEFATENGKPPMLTLEPWADVDEDQKEIKRLAAEQMANGII